MKEKTQNQNHHISSIKTLLGESFFTAEHCQYFFNRKNDQEDFGDFEIKTLSGKSVFFYLLVDGESVGASVGSMEIPEPIDFGDRSNASFQRKEITDLHQFSGNRISKIEAMIDKYHDSKSEILSGWRIYFEKRDFLVFYNCGDNGKLVINETPDNFPDGFDTRWGPIG